MSCVDELKMYIELPASAKLLGELLCSLDEMGLVGILEEDNETLVLKVRKDNS